MGSHHWRKANKISSYLQKRKAHFPTPQWESHCQQAAATFFFVPSSSKCKQADIYLSIMPKPNCVLSVLVVEFFFQISGDGAEGRGHRTAQAREWTDGRTEGRQAESSAIYSTTRSIRSTRSLFPVLIVAFSSRAHAQEAAPATPCASNQREREKNKILYKNNILLVNCQKLGIINTRK